MGIGVRYRGNPEHVGLLTQLIEAEGLTVEHDDLVRERSANGDWTVDVIVYVVEPPQLVKPKLETAIAKLKARFPRNAIEIVRTPEPLQPRPA